MAKPSKKVIKKTAKKKVAKKVAAKRPAPAKKAAARPAPAKKSAAKKKAPRAASAPRASSASAKLEVTGSNKSRQVSKPKSSVGTFTQSEFIEHLQAFLGLDKKSQAKEIALDIAALVTETLRKGYKIPLFGLGKIYVRSTKSRKGRNPATGEEITIPARKRVRFTPAKSLKEAVL